MEKYIITGIEKMVSEDDFKEGASVKSTVVVAEGHIGAFPTMAAAFKHLEKKYGFPSDQKDYLISDDGRLTSSRNENEDGYPPTKAEIKAWEEGKGKMWLADYDVYVEIAVTKEASVAELRKLGFETA